MLALGQLLPRPPFTNETAEASEGRRAEKETAGHISLQGSPSWSLSRHSPPCTGDQGSLTDLAACGTQPPGTAWPTQSGCNSGPDSTLAANDNNGDTHFQL